MQVNDFSEELLFEISTTQVNMASTLLAKRNK